MRTVIFDLDGTLADTSGDLIAAANACFQGLGEGVMLDPGQDQAVALRGARAMLRLGFDRLDGGHEQIEAQFPVLIEHYRAAISVHSHMLPGAVEAVEQLLHRGYRTGICTNKPEALAELLMQDLGVRSLFHSLIGADTLPVRKPDPAPFLTAVNLAGGAAAQSLLVGDTVTDRDTSRAAKVPSVLVAFGPSDVSELECDAVLPNYAELDDVVRHLIG
ncbi:HAD-IA family hydrolase [Candidatus Rhodobacter oscarellae]|nr:HAD-IA family hydrolase [Candidatus Rhodobacter lobularis]